MVNQLDSYSNVTFWKDPPDADTTEAFEPDIRESLTWLGTDAYTGDWSPSPWLPGYSPQHAYDLIWVYV